MLVHLDLVVFLQLEPRSVCVAHPQVSVLASQPAGFSTFGVISLSISLATAVVQTKHLSSSTSERLCLLSLSRSGSRSRVSPIQHDRIHHHLITLTLLQLKGSTTSACRGAFSPIYYVPTNQPPLKYGNHGVCGSENHLIARCVALCLPV